VEAKVVEAKVMASPPPPAGSHVRPPSPPKQDPTPQTFEIPVLKKVGRPPSPTQSEPHTIEKTVVESKPSAPYAPEQDTPGAALVVERLSQISALLEMQNKQLAELTKEVDDLKKQIAEDLCVSARKDEIIKKLELELQQARS